MPSVTVNSIDKIIILGNLLEVEITASKDGDNESSFVKSFLLEVNEKINWNPNEFVHVLAHQMYDKQKSKNKYDRRCDGKTLLERLETINTKEEFEKYIYTDFYNRVTTESRSNTVRIRGHFKLHPKNKEDTRLSKNINFRKSFAKAFFKNANIKSDQYRGGKTVDNAVYWLGNYEKTVVELGDRKELSEHNLYKLKTGRYCHNQNDITKEPSIFIGKENEYVRFILKTDDLTYDNLKQLKGFYVWDNEKDLSYYIDRDVNKKFRKHFNSDRHILIQGPPKVGKTRLVFEELKKQKGYYIFSLKQSILYSNYRIKLSDWFLKKKDKLIWFIDDIDYFVTPVDKLFMIYEELSSNNREIIIIATMRSSQNINTRIKRNMVFIHDKLWSYEEADDLSTNYGYDIKKFTGTPFSLKKDIGELKETYNDFKKDKQLNYVYILRYLKILSAMFEYTSIEFLRKVFLKFREEATADDFENGCNGLKNLGFVRIDNKLISSFEPIYQEIVTNKDYQDINNDMRKLNLWFRDENMLNELVILASYYFSIEEFNLSIQIINYVINIYIKLKDHSDEQLDLEFHRIPTMYLQLAMLQAGKIIEKGELIPWRTLLDNFYPSKGIRGK